MERITRNALHRRALANGYEHYAIREGVNTTRGKKALRKARYLRMIAAKEAKR